LATQRKKKAAQVSFFLRRLSADGDLFSNMA
jgi:hypothetical protein